MQKEKPGLIYVYNAIDASSRDFLSAIENIETSKNGAIAVNRIDVYKSNGLAQKLKVDKVPAIVITKNGQITDKLYELNSDIILNRL